MVTTTPKLGLKKPVPDAETDWGFRLNETIDALDDTMLTANTSGVDGVTVIDDGAGNPTISGFREEFVSASGALQGQIGGVTLQDAYDSGDGTIATTVAKPVEVTGEGFKVADNVPITLGTDDDYTITFDTASGDLLIDATATENSSIQLLAASGIKLGRSPGPAHPIELPTNPIFRTAPASFNQLTFDLQGSVIGGVSFLSGPGLGFLSWFGSTVGFNILQGGGVLNLTSDTKFTLKSNNAEIVILPAAGFETNVKSDLGVSGTILTRHDAGNPSPLSIAASNDTDTGIAFDTNNTIRIITANSQIAAYTSTGVIFNAPTLTSSTSEAAPGYSRNADSDTGIHMAANDTLELVAGGTTRLIASGTGASSDGVGIPDNLTVVGTTSLFSALALARKTNTEKDAISSPEAGFTIFNVTSGTVNTYDGTIWRELAYV